jgi:hypothetical protein
VYGSEREERVREEGKAKKRKGKERNSPLLFFKKKGSERCALKQSLPWIRHAA